MLIGKEIHNSLQNRLDVEISNSRPIQGGDIAESFLIKLSNGDRLFVKTLGDAPYDLFATEAAGLKALSSGGYCKTPAVIAVDTHYLALEYLSPKPATADYWQAFGQRLAQLHCLPQRDFGFDHDNYCGRTRQINTQESDGLAFFGHHRLGYQADLALSQRLIDITERKVIERLIDRLPQLIPEQAPALIHGDLWSGNHLCDENGLPVLIDPAAHRGWAEAEIAMTRLFSGFPDVFYQAYLEVNPLQPGWEERLPIYNLYHLLNHLNLFGSGYHSQVMNVVQHFS